MKIKKENNLAVILIVFLSFFIYLNSLSSPFNFDDFHGIVHNTYIKNPRYFPLFFKGYYTSEVFIPKGMLRPLLLLTYAFNYAFSQNNPIGYRLINILLHFLNGVLFYLLLKSLGKDSSFQPNSWCRDIPFVVVLFTTLLFIAHPINTETVVYISCRSDLLVTFFILSAFLCYVKNKYVLAVFSYILALFSKETALIFPFLIAGYEVFLKPLAKEGFSLFKKSDFNKPRITGLQSWFSVIRGKHILFIILMGVTAIYWVYRSNVIGVGVRGSFLAPFSSYLRSFWSNILTQSAVSMFYLRLFFWPHPLSIDHGFPALNSLSQPLALFSILGMIIISACIFIFRRKAPLISFGLLWYLVCLLPKFYAKLNLVAAEHHFYLPSLGVYIILIVFFRKLYKHNYRYFFYLGTGLISIFAVLAGFRNYEWSDTQIFWEKARDRGRNPGYAYQTLAMMYAKRHEYGKAKEELRKAIEANKEITYLQVNNWVLLAGILVAQERYDEAKEILDKLIAFDPKSFEVQIALGMYYSSTNNYEEAEKIWKKCLELYPNSWEIRLKLGYFYLYKKHDLKQAKEYFLDITEYNPELPQGFVGLGFVLEEEGDQQGALKAYQNSVKASSKNAIGYFALGTFYAKRGDSRSLWYLKEAVKLDPYLNEAHNNLSILYMSMDPPQMGIARIHAQKALDLGYKVKKELLEMLGLSREKKLQSSPSSLEK